MRAVGIDFGTTNSAVAVAHADGRVEALSWPSAAGPQGVYRSALAFWSEGRGSSAVLRHAAGPEALDHVVSGAPGGRFIQSLKTYLASRALTDTRLFGRRFSVEDLVATFLRHMVPDPGALGTDGGVPVAAGRPVIFAGERPDEALATQRLETSFAKAGFASVELAYEPLGAAYWYARALKRSETVLVADFGGGTSDFSVIRFERRGVSFDALPLSHGGVGIAGDTFDFRLIDRYVAPRLGKGAHYRSFDKLLPIPAYIHAAFAHWHQLSWLKTPATMAELRKLAAASDHPDELERLIEFVDLDLGFDLYRAVSAAKLRLSEADEAELDFMSHGIAIAARIRRPEFESAIARDLDRIAAAADETVLRAGLRHADIDAVFTTGGTSQVPAVRRLFVERFGAERLHAAHPLQSVASGLALLAADRVRVAAA